MMARSIDYRSVAVDVNGNGNEIHGSLSIYGNVFVLFLNFPYKLLLAMQCVTVKES